MFTADLQPSFSPLASRVKKVERSRAIEPASRETLQSSWQGRKEQASDDRFPSLGVDWTGNQK